MRNENIWRVSCSFGRSRDGLILSTLRMVDGTCSAQEFCIAFLYERLCNGRCFNRQ